MTLRLVCRNLSAGWPGKTLVANFSTELSFSALNDALPIVGRTGRGKSTLLYALSGMSRPETGAITWFLPDDVSWTGDAASFKAVNQVRQRRFGFMLQDAALIPCFTVAENLRHIFDLRRTGAPVGNLVERSIETMLIEGETIGDFLLKYPSQLSGGMRQRMALAAAIVHSPQVLFADEPTASLDDASGLEVLKVVRRWLDEKPGERAFVFVTHRVETLREGAGATNMVRLATETVDRVTRIVPRVVPIQ